MSAAAEAVAGELVQADDLKDVNSAVARFDTVAAGVAALQAQYGGVVYDVTAPKGMEAAKEARRAVREPRYEIEKVRKAAKAPILALGRRIDGEAERITKQLLAIEDPIDQQIKTEEARKEAERQAAIEADRQRLAAIDQRIDAMRTAPVEVAGKAADIIRARLDELYEPAEFDFQERIDIAKSVRADAIARLEAMLAERETFEAEQERLRQEHEAAAARQLEEDERRRREDARLQQERERLAAERAEQERIAAEERARLQAERDAAEAAERERQAQARREQEERDRQEAERQARIREDEERIARQRRELEQQTAYNEQARHFSDLLGDARDTEEPVEATSLRNAVSGTPIEEAVYGQWAGRLRDLRDQTVASIDLIIDSFTTSEPSPAAAAELTSEAVSSPPASDSAAPAAVTDPEDEIGALLVQYPYPGHQALVRALMDEFEDLPEQAARQWLLIYAEANLPDEAVL